jgi:phosphoribosyl-dephospho-CoA transferase
MSARIHDLLEIDAERFLQGQSSAPGWVAESLRDAPFVVVRRGPTEEGLPIGVRGPQRNERWAGVCHPDIVRAIVTPQMLLSRVVPATRSAAIPALCSLPCLAERWREFGTPWGPGGSVGFELATGRHVTTPQSDLDIVIYADTPMTASTAQTLRDCAQGLPAAVDIRVETRSCGFSLTEYASRSPAPILIRFASGTVLAADPWATPK